MFATTAPTGRSSGLILAAEGPAVAGLSATKAPRLLGARASEVAPVEAVATESHLEALPWPPRSHRENVEQVERTSQLLSGGVAGKDRYDYWERSIQVRASITEGVKASHC